MIVYVDEAKPINSVPANPTIIAKAASLLLHKNQSRADTKATLKPGNSRGNSRKDL